MRMNVRAHTCIHAHTCMRARPHRGGLAGQHAAFENLEWLHRTARSSAALCRSVLKTAQCSATLTSAHICSYGVRSPMLGPRWGKTASRSFLSHPAAADQAIPRKPLILGHEMRRPLHERLQPCQRVFQMTYRKCTSPARPYNSCPLRRLQLEPLQVTHVSTTSICAV